MNGKVLSLTPHIERRIHEKPPGQIHEKEGSRAAFETHLEYSTPSFNQIRLMILSVDRQQGDLIKNRFYEQTFSEVFRGSCQCSFLKWR